MPRIKKFLFIFFLTLPVFVLVDSQITNGHSLGQSFEKEVGGYMVDIGYDAPTDKLMVDATTRFDFNLWTDKTKTAIADYSYVWVRITPLDRGITFASFLHYPEPLSTGMSYTFQKDGEYELTVRFLDKQDRTLAEASFPLIVMGSKKVPAITYLIIGAVTGAAIVYFLIRRKNDK